MVGFRAAYAWSKSDAHRLRVRGPTVAGAGAASAIAMPYRLVTCPETGHLEEIAYVDSPLGMLIARCSRYVPRCSVACPRTCAARFDLRSRLARIRLAIGDTTRIAIDCDVPEPKAKPVAST
jgi:hypothetical protein